MYILSKKKCIKHTNSIPNERVQNTVNQHVSKDLTFIISRKKHEP